MYWENLLMDDIRAPLDMKNVSLHVVLFSEVGNCYCRSPSVWLSDRFRFTSFVSQKNLLPYLQTYPKRETLLLVKTSELRGGERHSN